MWLAQNIKNVLKAHCLFLFQYDPYMQSNRRHAAIQALHGFVGACIASIAGQPIYRYGCQGKNSRASSQDVQAQVRDFILASFMLVFLCMIHKYIFMYLCISWQLLFKLYISPSHNQGGSWAL
jgi:hypothetical protein